MNISELKTQFLEYIEIEKGRAVKTVETYDRYLTLFIEQTKIKEVCFVGTHKQYEKWYLSFMQK